MTTRRLLASGAMVGAAGGFIGSLLGVGGGVIMVSLMVGVLGLGQHRAHGTSLLAIFPISAIGVAIYALSGAFDGSEGGSVDPAAFLLIGVLMAIGSIIGVTAGARLMNRLSDQRLKLVFGLFLVAVAARLLFFA